MNGIMHGVIKRSSRVVNRALLHIRKVINGVINRVIKVIIGVVRPPREGVFNLMKGFIHIPNGF